MIIKLSTKSMLRKKTSSRKEEEDYKEESKDIKFIRNSDSCTVFNRTFHTSKGGGCEAESRSH
jgi:hypothetical protein